MRVIYKDKKGNILKKSYTDVKPEIGNIINIDSKNYKCVKKMHNTREEDWRNTVYVTVERVRGKVANESIVSVTKKGDDIVCKKCKFVEIGSFTFDDMTRSVICTRYNQFLGFTNKDLEIVEVNGLIQCKNNPLIRVLKKDPIKNIVDGGGYGKSGVKHIHWNTSCKKWRVKYYNRRTKEHVELGKYADLEEAKRVLEEFLKERDRKLKEQKSC